MMNRLSIFLVLLILMAYVGFVQPWLSGNKSSPSQLDFYNRQTNAFLEGQISLLKKPPESLLRLKDPYDPEQNGRIIRNQFAGLWDLSLYKDKLYIYFGVGPVLTLFLPFRVLSGGIAIAPWVATLIFCAAAFLVAILILKELKKLSSESAAVSTAWLIIGIPLLGLGSGLQFLLHAAAHYEIAVACGVFFTLLCTWLCIKGLSKNRRRDLLLAALALGLAISCRPHLVLIVPAFAILILRVSENKRTDLGYFTAPIVITIIGLLSYNYVRFDSPFEFGNKYQIGMYNSPKIKYISPDYFPRSGHLVFLQKPVLRASLEAPIRLKPRAPRKLEKVKNHFTEGAAGIVWVLPLAVVGIILILTPWVRNRLASYSSSIPLAVVDCLWMSALTVLLLISFYCATITRYLVDALPLLALAAWGSVLPLFQKPIVYKKTVIILALLALYSALAWVSITYATIFIENTPR